MKAAAAVEHAFHVARAERRIGDGAGVLAALKSAAHSVSDLPGGHPLRARWAWKLAKAHTDFSIGASALDALGPALEGGWDLYTGYPTSRKAAQTLGRRHQDQWGYGHPLLVPLWEGLADACTAAGDPDGGAAARLDVAWVHLCRGEFDVLDASLAMLDRSTAADPVGVAYTRLCAAVWALDPARLERAHPAMLAQLDDLPCPRHVTIVLHESAQRFGTRPPTNAADDAYVSALLGRRAFDGVPELRRSKGPEFQLAAEQSAFLAGQAAAPAVRWGCAIFEAANPTELGVP